MELEIVLNVIYIFVAKIDSDGVKIVDFLFLFSLIMRLFSFNTRLFKQMPPKIIQFIKSNQPPVCI